MAKKRFLAIGMGAMLCIPLNACSENETKISPAYVTEFKQASEASKSQFVKDIMNRAAETGSISRADYLEASKKLVNCYKEAGLYYERAQDAGFGFEKYYVSIPDGDKDSMIKQQLQQRKCDFEWDGEPNLSISQLYESQVSNPEYQEESELKLACLKRHKLVPDTLTRHDWDDYVSRTSATCTPIKVNGRSQTRCTNSEGATWNPALEEQPPNVEAYKTLPGGHKRNDPEVTRCILNPTLDLYQKKQG